MPTPSLLRSLCLLSCLASGLLAAAEPGQNTETLVVKFSDPGKPGTLRAAMPWASLKVRGTDTEEVRVTVTYPVKEHTPSGRMLPEGLRRLNGGAETAYQIAENDNVVTLYGGGKYQWVAQLDIEVPRKTLLSLQSQAGGDIVAENLEGDVEIGASMGGGVRLQNLTGSIIVSVADGELDVGCNTAPTRPISLNSTGGEITFSLPKAAAASLRLRAYNGAIYTDFDENTLKVATTAPATPNRAVAAVRPPAKLPVAQVPVDARARAFVMSPQYQSLMGGRILAGELNGGGTEITAATMNGAIIVRQAR